MNKQNLALGQDGVQRADNRGTADYGWLQANYGFSFAEYLDPERMGYRSLRVLNEDHIAGGGAFPRHGHQNMEIVTYILEGALEHQDSAGNRGVLHAGDYQVMSAGTGIHHSEANASSESPLHLYQIWILPDANGHSPRYSQGTLTDQWNTWRLIAYPGDAGPRPDHDSGLPIHQSAFIYSAKIRADEELAYALEATRHGMIQVMRGQVLVDGLTLSAGDSKTFSAPAIPLLTASVDSEVLLFDLA